MRRFHPSRTPGTRAGPSVPPERARLCPRSRFPPSWPSGGLSRTFPAVPARAGRYHPYRPFRALGRRFSHVSAVFIRLAVPVAFSPACAGRWPWARVRGLAARPGHRARPVAFSSVSGSRCRFHPFCAVCATRGAVFTRFVLFRPRAVPFSPVSASRRRLHPFVPFGALGRASVGVAARPGHLPRPGPFSPVCAVRCPWPHGRATSASRCRFLPSS